MHVLLSAYQARLEGSGQHAAEDHSAVSARQEDAVSLLLSRLECEQDAGLCWLMKGLLCDVRLDQAEHNYHLVIQAEMLCFMLPDHAALFRLLHSRNSTACHLFNQPTQSIFDCIWQHVAWSVLCIRANA